MSDENQNGSRPQIRTTDAWEEQVRRLADGTQYVEGYRMEWDDRGFIEVGRDAVRDAELRRFYGLGYDCDGMGV